MSPPERWLVVSARPPGHEPEGEARLADGLLRLGGRAVEERDGWLATALPGPPPGRISVETVRARLRALTGMDVVDVDLAWREHEDWAEAWRRGLGPRWLTDRLVVTPSWADPAAVPGDVVVVVDPGVAFGTAEHGTTRGCIRLLVETVREGDTVLDVGAGSAILAIVAARLGARRVTALEGDPMALPTARENVERNGVGDRVEVEQVWATPEVLGGLRPVDGVVANIESGVLLGLADGFRRALGAGGWLILSGVLGGEWADVSRQVTASGFREVAVDRDGEWRSGLFRRT